jgi:hypothetical protein
MGFFADLFKCGRCHVARGRPVLRVKQPRRLPCTDAASLRRLGLGARRRETPQEQVRRWQRVIRTEMRAVDRQIAGARPPARPRPRRAAAALRTRTLSKAPRAPSLAPHSSLAAAAAAPFLAPSLTHTRNAHPVQRTDIQRESKKTEKSIKECVKRSDVRSARVLARELVRTRATVSRMYASKAQMNSVTMHLNENLGAPHHARTHARTHASYAAALMRTHTPLAQPCTARWATSRRARS